MMTHCVLAEQCEHKPTCRGPTPALAAACCAFIEATCRGGASCVVVFVYTSTVQTCDAVGNLHLHSAEHDLAVRAINRAARDAVHGEPAPRGPRGVLN